MIRAMVAAGLGVMLVTGWDLQAPPGTSHLRAVKEDRDGDPGRMTERDNQSISHRLCIAPAAGGEL